MPFRFFARPSELRLAGILGINQRNGEYILAHNPRSRYPCVDDKLLTKQLCMEHGIPTPETFAAIRHFGEIREFPKVVRDRPEFVIKPAAGSAGRGIVVVANHNGDSFFSPGGNEYSDADIQYHLSMVLSGLYSLGGQMDAAIIEQRIVTHSAFERISHGGTPDVRIIVYRGIPVMAMLRLPTSQSGGRANLHQGAIAAAVDLATGRTFGGVCRNHVVSNHPDTGEPIAGFKMPQWRTALESAMKLSDATGLGYVGVDQVIDATAGPIVLEANARPGLSIQVANREGLLEQLKAVDALPAIRSGVRISIGERLTMLIPAERSPLKVSA